MKRKRGAEKELERKAHEPLEDYLDRLYSHRVKAIDKQEKQLEQGTHPEYAAGVQGLAAEKEERLRAAVRQQAVDVELATVMFEREKAKLLDQSQERKEARRLQLIAEAEKELLLAKDQFELQRIDMDEFETLGTRHTRKKLRPRNDEALNADAKLERDPAKSGPTVILELDDGELREDLRFLSSRKGLSAPTIHPVPPAARELPVFYEDDKICFDNKWYWRGSKVAVEWQDGSNQRFVGVLVHVNQTSVWVRAIDGSRKVRLLLSKLARGVYVLKSSTKMGP